MGISYERHGDRTYVYRVSSRREAGRKNPVSYKEYLGVLDEGSGTIIPKPIPLDEIPPAFHDGRFRMMEYGNVRVCGSVAERLFIKDDLESVFGDCYRTILALAISRAISPGSTSDPTRIADRLFLADVLGHSRRLSQDSIRKAAGAISYDSVKRFYGLSRERHPQHTYLFMVSDPMNRTRGNSHESYRHPSLSDACIILMADDSGDPFAAGLTFGRKGDARIFAEFVSKDPKSYTLVVGDGRADAKMMAKAIMGRTEVMVQCTSGIDRIIHMLAPTIEHYILSLTHTEEF